MRFEWNDSKNETNIRKHGAMNKASESDWKKLAELNAEEIDTSDIPELDDDFFAQAELRVPAKQSVTLRLEERSAYEQSQKNS